MPKRLTLESPLHLTADLAATESTGIKNFDHKATIAMLVGLAVAGSAFGAIATVSADNGSFFHTNKSP